MAENGAQEFDQVNTLVLGVLFIKGVFMLYGIYELAFTTTDAGDFYDS